MLSALHIAKYQNEYLGEIKRDKMLAM